MFELDISKFSYLKLVIFNLVEALIFLSRKLK